MFKEDSGAVMSVTKIVAAGDLVEIAFKSFPSRISTGKADAVLEYTGEGQILTSGVLPSAASIRSKGFLAVRIDLDDEAFARELPLGGAGTTAIYTKVGGPFHAITKIALRMKAGLTTCRFRAGQDWRQRQNRGRS